jgi:hypothetical protein
MLNTNLRDKNKAIIKITGMTESFRGIMKSWNMQLKKGLLTHFPSMSVDIHANGALDESVYILCNEKILKAFENIKTCSCVSLPIHCKRGTKVTAAVISLVF